MTKKQVVQKMESKVEEVKQVGDQIQETATIEVPQTDNEDSTSNEITPIDGNTSSDTIEKAGGDDSIKNNETIQIPEFVNTLLKLHDTYLKLYIDSKGGVFVQPHDDATEYANPYFIQ